MTIKNTGIINKAKLAREKYVDSQKKEIEFLNSYDNEKLENSRESSPKQNINIYINDKKTDIIPKKESEYIYTTYTTNDNNASLKFDYNNWNFSINNLTNSSAIFNIYFYEKDSLNVALKLLNSTDKFNSKEEFVKNKQSEILNSEDTINYILNSDGEMKEYFSLGDNYQSAMVQAYADGDNTQEYTLPEGAYIFKFSCNESYVLKKLYIDDKQVDLKGQDGTYIFKIKTKIKVLWYSNHPGVPKYLTLKYRKMQ